MPVENETKYILSQNTKEQIFSGWEKVDIRQGYLDDGPRVRQFGADYYFTYKKWIPTENVLLEIETDLSETDFDRLWPLCSVSLTKTRFIKQIGEIEWVVDFLSDGQNNIYFVLAEAEMPEAFDRPDFIPEEIKKHVVFIVEKDDDRFTNKKLTDPKYAIEAYNSITE